MSEEKKHSPGFVALVEDAKTRIRQVDVAAYPQFARDNPGHLLIDVREESEWTAGRAAGSLHLSKGIIERDIEEKVPNKDALMVLYCGGGYRSALAADSLRRMGYTSVLSLAGGWRAWQAANMPQEK